MEIVLDCIGEMCPIPIIRMEKALKTLSAGDRVTVKTDHSCTTQIVIDHFQKKMGYPCFAEEIDYGIWQISVEKSV